CRVWQERHFANWRFPLARSPVLYGAGRVASTFCASSSVGAGVGAAAAGAEAAADDAGPASFWPQAVRARAARIRGRDAEALIDGSPGAAEARPCRAKSESGFRTPTCSGAEWVYRAYDRRQGFLGKNRHPRQAAR